VKYKFLSFSWKDEFINILSRTKKEIFISSPYINVAGVEILSNIIQMKSSINIFLLTNLTIQNIINRSNEPSALLELYKLFNQVKISSLGKLHAKVYIIDNEIGIITSANLTSGGLLNNFEYGILIDDKNVASTIKNGMLKYFSVGNIFDENLLVIINEESKKLYKIKYETDNLAKDTKLAQLLKKAAETIDSQLLKNRIKSKTINAIFSDTIVYILKKKGSLNTSKINPLIQSIHPDICDDSIDRVIEGQHFGKKWKHSVRSAQQSLKREGLIYLKDRKWCLMK